MRSGFEKWMKNEEEKVSGTVSNYADAIDRISEHYTSETGKNIDIYQIEDMPLLKRICREYRRGGRFEVFGNEHHGLYRAAISAYVRYFEKTVSVNNGINGETNLSVSDSKIAVKRDSKGNITISINLLIEEEKKVKSTKNDDMTGHDFNFEGGNFLARMGATWFVSYSYYCHIDKSLRIGRKYHINRVSVFSTGLIIIINFGWNKYCA
jgi:hypothetical protein